MSKRKYVFGETYYEKTLRPKLRAVVRVDWLDRKVPWTSGWKTRVEIKARRKVKCISKSDISSIESFHM